MKKIGKNTKLYLIGMIIGGITLGITTVIADTIINSTSVAYKTTTVKAALDELYDIADFKQEVKDMLYPVGSIYISVSGTNPSQLFGGTWVSFGMGRTLLGIGLNESNNNDSFGNQPAGILGHMQPEIMSGEYTHLLTVNEMPSHTHGINQALHWDYAMSGYVCNTCDTKQKAWLINTTSVNGWFSTNSAGNSAAHANMPPYITVYMWKRTA